jgi:hypothetical protein
MTDPSPSALVERFAPVGLAELEDAAALLSRVDRKYVVPLEIFAALAARLDRTHGALEIGGTRAFRYRTTYFDTHGLDAYREHVQRRRRRYKCRTRRYEDSGTCAFELKLKGTSGRTVKHRMPYEEAPTDVVSPQALEWVGDRLVAYGREPAGSLEPTLRMAYRRLTLVDRERGERLTCDLDLRFSGAGGRAGRLVDGAAILESKSARGTAIADLVLRELGARPVQACSKYCLGIGLTRPDVRTNPFKRLLSRWFVAVAAGAALAGGAAGAPAPAAAAGLPRLAIDAPRTVPETGRLDARMRVVAGGRTVFRGHIGIRVRGQSSRRFAKPSYSVETRTRSGENRDVGLLGLPRDDDWVLYAAYNDATLLRNVVAYRAARRLGRYAARTRFVELRLNGRYRGVYVLMERLKLTRDRIGFGDDDGFLVEGTAQRKLRPGDRAFRTPVLGWPVAFSDPAGQDLRAARAAAIREQIGRLETALYGEGFADPLLGYRAFLDVPAAVDFVLVNELLRNQDAFRASTFMHARTGERLRLGPVWDFDLAMGNSPNPARNPAEGWLLGFHPWSERLYGDSTFVAQLAGRWRAVRAAGLVEHLLAGVEADARRLRTAQGRNFRRWPLPRAWLRATPAPAGKRVRPDHAAEVAHLKRWIQRRATWMDADLAGA